MPSPPKAPNSASSRGCTSSSRGTITTPNYRQRDPTTPSRVVRGKTPTGLQVLPDDFPSPPRHHDSDDYADDDFEEEILDESSPAPNSARHSRDMSNSRRGQPPASSQGMGSRGTVGQTYTYRSSVDHGSAQASPAPQSLSQSKTQTQRSARSPSPPPPVSRGETIGMGTTSTTAYRRPSESSSDGGYATPPVSPGTRAKQNKNSNGQSPSSAQGSPHGHGQPSSVAAVPMQGAVSNARGSALSEPRTGGSAKHTSSTAVAQDRPRGSANNDQQKTAPMPAPSGQGAASKSPFQFTTPPRGDHHSNAQGHGSSASASTASAPLRSPGRGGSAGQPPRSPGHTAASPVSVQSPTGGELQLPRVNMGHKELIGRGSFGEVYQALDMNTNRVIAVKVIRAPPGQASESMKNLEREIRVMQKLDHPNIVKYLGSSRDNEGLNIYMEYVPCGTMTSRLTRFGPQPEDATAKLVHQVLNGLDYLHARRIAHRDLKGDNLYLDQDGSVKVGDFGTAKEMKTITMTHSVTGTPYFMAPEVIQNGGHGLQADVWSLGCVVIQLLTGKPPFHNHTAPMTIMFQVSQGRIAQYIPNDIPEDTKDFVVQCTKKSPEDRPTCRELLSHPWIMRHCGYMPPPATPGAASLCGDASTSSFGGVGAYGGTPPDSTTSAPIPNQAPTSSQSDGVPPTHGSPSNGLKRATSNVSAGQRSSAHSSRKGSAAGQGTTTTGGTTTAGTGHGRTVAGRVASGGIRTNGRTSVSPQAARQTSASVRK